ncbi:hypothetical protein J27TS8_40370 [Robertmurraya siralis]|uniref:Uncharacterized protein n=1 Tax=Robertmurraya siralis TaxID=77777 RepID=A0A919WLP9_9BACI|nr:hypothetical protein J27TS8_40370 [Robertmurraya siralis]
MNMHKQSERLRIAYVRFFRIFQNKKKTLATNFGWIIRISKQFASYSENRVYDKGGHTYEV